MPRFIRRNASAATLLLVSFALLLSTVALTRASDSASSQAGHADTNSATALARLRELVVQLQSATAAECYRVDYLRWNIDRANFRAYQRDQAAARFLNAARFPGVRRLGGVFLGVASAEDFLPLTDCTQADTRPSTYTPPVAVPFDRVPIAVVLRTLAHPPRPPVGVKSPSR